MPEMDDDHNVAAEQYVHDIFDNEINASDTGSVAYQILDILDVWGMFR